MAGSQYPAAAGGDQLRAGYADREQVIETLKDAFVHGRLTRDELDARAGRALAARTYADLAALTTDILPAPVAAGPARPPTPARGRPLARAAAGSGICLSIAVTAMWAHRLLDPGSTGHPYQSWAVLFALLATVAVLTAPCLLVYGVVTSVEQRRSRRQLPPGSPDGRLEAGWCGGTSPGPVPPGPRTDQTHADLRADQPRRHNPARPGRAPRGIRPAPGAA